MPRRSLLLAILVLIPACEDAEFTRLSVYIDRDLDETFVYLSGNEGAPCPSLVYGDVETRANGVRGVVNDYGDDRDDGGCYAVEIRFDELTFGGGVLDLLVDDGDLHVEARAEWLAVWSDDDLAAAYTAGVPFTVQWSPADATLPVLDVYQGNFESAELDVEPIGEPTAGSAQYQFVGAATSAEPLVVVGDATLEADPTICTGVAICTFPSEIRFEVGPRE